MASLAHATIVNEARVAPTSFDRAPIIRTAEDFTPLIADDLDRERVNPRHRADSLPTMDCPSGAPFAREAKLKRGAGNAAR